MGIYSPVALAAVVVATALDKLTGGLLFKFADRPAKVGPKATAADESLTPSSTIQRGDMRPAVATAAAPKTASAAARVQAPSPTVVTPLTDDDELIEPRTPGMR